MNWKILSREFENLAATIEKDENKKANEETVMLDPNFFDAPEQASDVLYNPATVAHKGHPSKTTVPSVDISRVERRAEYLPDVKEIREKISKSEDNKGDRKAIITKLLSKKGGLSIKDFSQAIKGCSEKTIQRELLSMVAAGVLKKEGERRWSTYSLAK